MGQGIGEGISDTVSGLFSTSDPFGGIDSFDMAESMSGVSLGKVDEVGKINSDVNIADEDIKLLKDVAEMRYVQNFVTLAAVHCHERQRDKGRGFRHVL